jgi:O-antigen/teichoic acid export membrane protein
MRIGQTSLVFFISKIVGSILGFVATIYFARELGAGVLGTYSLVLAVVAWIGIAGTAGITGAVGKRMSEREDQSEYFTAGLLSLIVTFSIVGTLVYAFAGVLTAYIGEPLVNLVVLLILLRLLDTLIKGGLVGTDRVHIMGVLIPVRMLFRSVSQIGLVFLGYRLVGMLVGNALGFFLAALIGVWYLPISLTLPSKRHFQSLFSYAKFSWLASVENRVFGWIDISVLGLFVASGLIGIYSVSWTISTFFLSFSVAVSNAIFPQISNLSANQDEEAVASILTDALRYAGLILIPGVVGGFLLNQRILRIYGPEFQQGGTVLVVLLLSVLLRSYYNQMVTTFNAMDRADITFRINGVFIAANVMLNLALVYAFGWIGAAVATALSTGAGVVFASYYLRRLVTFEVPYADIGRQLLAAGIMGGTIVGLLWIERWYVNLQHNFALVLLLVSLGAGIYFVSLLYLSKHFRTTVSNNLPEFV